MALLKEFAITPDVFDSTCYSSNEIGDIRLNELKNVLRDEAVVRDLRNGEWSALFSNVDRPWHRRGKELLKKLKQQNRLHLYAPSLITAPNTDCDWCKEAIASHNELALGGIISTKNVVDSIQYNNIVASIEKLSSSPWWSAISPSVRVNRNLDSYRENLDLVLKCSKSIMFIDPHFDPDEERYEDFASLLCTMADRTPVPLLEIHRVCYKGSGRSRDIIENASWRSKFAQYFEDPFRETNLSVEVFIWDDFHDRYIISDLIGILLSNGFDTTTSSKSLATWARVGRNDRDDIQREFDPASHRHNLKYRFRIPL
jgi:hypothetical protein